MKRKLRLVPYCDIYQSETASQTRKHKCRTLFCQWVMDWILPSHQKIMCMD